MPPKKNINKGRDAVTPTIKKPKIRKVKKNTLSGKNLKISIKNNINATRKEYKVKSQINNKQENVLLTKRDINIILANEVLKTQFPKRKSILESFELNHTEQIDLPKKVKGNKTLPAKLNEAVKKKVIKRKLDHPVESVQPKTQERKITRKRKADIQETESSNVLIEADNNGKLKKTRSKTGRSKKLDLKNNQIKNEEIKAKPLTEVKTVKKRKLPVKPALVKRSVRQVNVTPKPNPDIDKSSNAKTEESLAIKVDVPVQDVVVEQISKENNNIISDGLRRASICSELSWTKDISSCSTTSCVTVSPNDFIRIDNKLPIIKLTKVKRDCVSQNTPNLISDSNKSLNNEASSEVPSQLDEITTDERTGMNASLNLSSSSSSSSDSTSSSSSSSISKNSLCLNKMKTEDYLSKLSSHLKLIDLECIEWIGYKNNSDNWSQFHLEDFTQNSIFKSNVLKEEKMLLKHCETIERLLCKYKKMNSSLDISENTGKEILNDRLFSLPNESEGQTMDKNIVLQGFNSTGKSELAEHFTISNTCSNLPANNSSSKYAEENDDDDALSLYAESITGLDTSRKNSSVQNGSDLHNIEEYVPTFVTKTIKPPKQITYHPTKIVGDKRNDCQDNVATVCEKQNADSTSINKEPDVLTNISEHIIYEDRRGQPVEPKSNATNSISTQPTKHIRLVADNYKATRGIKSLVYKNVCFYNIISACKLVNCKFPHNFPKWEEVETKVSMLDEESFVTEYMLTRSVPELRRKYGLCFVIECIKRKMTRLLVEMAIDFITKADNMVREDEAIKIEVVEQTLLYLNIVDLHVVSDLLQFVLLNVNGVLLCEFLLKIIAESQNFTRFVPIFINLVCFMITIDCSFDIDVSTQLLERVCILPYEEKLARALIEVIKRTSDSIFYNFMIEKFENLLFSSNRDLYEAFTFLKKRKMLNQADLASPYIPQYVNREVERVGGAGMSQLDKDMRYSPDTTNFDNLNKSFEPKLTRTIEVNQNRIVEDWAHMVSNSSSCSEDRTPNGHAGTRALSRGCRGRQRGNFQRRLDYNSYGGNKSNTTFTRSIHSDNVNFKRAYTSLPSNSSSGSDRGQMGPRPRNSPHFCRGSLNRRPFNRRTDQNNSFGYLPVMQRSGRHFF